MKSWSQTGVGAFAVLTLLLLTALAVGAQSALAGHFSHSSVITSPPAGTEGRGGVASSTVALVLTKSPQAGTEGRGGASLAVAAVTPAAGTEGRGGVAAAPVPTLAGESTVAENGFVSRGRGGLPAGPTGVSRTSASSVTSSSSGWIVAGIVAAVALIAGFVLWAAERRRTSRRQSSLASYCAYHPGDPLCGSA